MSKKFFFFCCSSPCRGASRGEINVNGEGINLERNSMIMELNLVLLSLYRLLSSSNKAAEWLNSLRIE